MKKQKKGISLIVLVITIIVIIILASAVILSITANNPIEKAGEASFKSSLNAYKSELTLYLAEQQLLDYDFRSNTVNADSTNIASIITSIKDEHKAILYIEEGVLKLAVSSTSEQKEWAKGILEVATLKISLQVINKSPTTLILKATGSDTNSYMYKVDNASWSTGTTGNYEVTGLTKNTSYTIYVKSTTSTGETIEHSQSLLTANSTWDDPYIPQGFVKSTTAGETTVDRGLVIKEGSNGAATNQNEFVWVPVQDFNNFVRVEYGMGNAIYPAGEATWDNVSTTTELDKIYKSVKENGGFYIARYEAGKETASPLTNGTYKPVSKKNVDVWHTIFYGAIASIDSPGDGAVVVSRAMYNNNTDIASNLIYGVQWDAALEFISNKGINNTTYATNSTGLGNYRDADSSNNPAKTGLVDTYALNNIYDMAGNVWELTMEANSSSRRIYRGGSYFYPATDTPVCFRIGDDEVTYSYSAIGFRLALYIK